MENSLLAEKQVFYEARKQLFAQKNISDQLPSLLDSWKEAATKALNPSTIDSYLEQIGRKTSKDGLFSIAHEIGEKVGIGINPLLYAYCQKRFGQKKSYLTRLLKDVREKIH